MKSFPLFTRTCVAVLCAAAVSVTAQVSLSPVAEAMVRNGANVNVDMDEATLGYLMVKYGSANSGKSYFKFDFTGVSPNTNADLTLTFTTYTASQRQRPVVWALNQAYPGFTSSVLVWNTAQANETTGNGMLTDTANPFTATPLKEFISPNSANVTATVTVPAPWGDYLIGNQLVLVLTSPFNDPTNRDNGLRLQLNNTTLGYHPIYGGSPPTIGLITNITVGATQTSDAQPFTVNDPEDGPDGLWPYAYSSNEAVVPSGNVIFDGSGANRTVQVIAGNTAGVADVTVTLYDASGNMANRTFQVTVIPANFVPVISTPPPTNTLRNTAVTIPFTVADAESPATSLTVTGWVASYSEHLLAGVTVDADASGTNRTMTVTPVTDATGVGVVSLRVIDPEANTTTISFAVMVLPGADFAFFDPFDYPLNTSIIDSSPGFWVRRNAGVASVNFRTYSGGTQAWIRPSSSADHGVAPLAGRPFTPGSGAILYTSFKAQWIDVGGVPVVGDSDGAFILLAPSASATADQLVRVGTVTNGVPEGYFQLLLSNGGPTFTPYTALDLSVGSLYDLMVRYDVDTAQSTMWINAGSETDPGLAAIDSQAPASVGYVCIRQMSGMGNILVDDLTVRVVYKPTLTSVTPPAGGNVEILFRAGAGDEAADFEVQRASEVTGPFTTVTANIVPAGADQFKATVAASGERSFYRVKRLPQTF